METTTDLSTTVKSQEGFKSAYVVNITIGFLGLIGNAFVCLVMLQYRSVFNSTTNKLIIHQSIVDFLASFLYILRLFLVVSPPATVPDNILGSIYCKFWWSQFPQFSMFITSSYNLVAISIERYYATCQPVKHRNMFSNRLLKMIMVAVWICGWIPESHVFFLSYQINDECNISWPSPTAQFFGGVLIFLTDLVIPLSVMTFAYTKIILELRKRSRARAEDNNQDARNMLSRAEKNVTKTLVVVAVFFAICWTPADTNYLLFNFGANITYVNSAVLDTVTATVAMNLCINPFIYCFTYERFQKQAKKMVFGRCQRNVNRVDTTSGSTRQETNVQQASATVSVVCATDSPAQP